MYIARLQLKGFKSFGGTYDLQLSPGMTAIVGPNGSGKSNLLDALRWVLGDSHASKLRVAKQGGLIFHGSASREAATEGEVGIQMRDGTRVCTIRRKVSEAGTTVSIDGARATLTELDEAKRLWQLSGDQFAFIGQGEVSEVIQQRPTARRILLESLFGIDAYRKRRSEAADRLGEVRDEFIRLRTFSAELSSRREEIAPAVEKAREASELIEAMEDDRRLLYWVRRARCEAAASSLEEARRDALAAAEIRRAWRAAWERSLEQAGAGEDLSHKQQSQSRELDELKETISSLTRSAYALGSSKANAARRAAQIAGDRSAQERKLESLRGERDRLAAESRHTEQELSAVKIKLAAMEDSYAAMRDEIEAARIAREDRSRAAGEIDGEITALKARMRSVSQALRELEAGASSQGRSAKDDAAKRIARELGELERRHEELLELQEKCAEEHRDIYAKLQQATTDLQRARREHARTSSRLAELQEQASVEMYPRPVQHVLSASKLGRTQARPVAAIDAFSCGEELATAIDAFLGGRQFWLLVDTMDEAGELIELLKKNRMGRATFLPLERTRPRTPDRSYSLPRGGIVGWATELVKVDKKWRPAIDHLMGDLLIVESYAVGQSLVRGGFRGPITTLDGDVFQPGGTVSGGASQKPGKTIEIKSALAKLEAELEASRSTVAKLQVEFGELEQQEIAASGRKEAAAVDLRELSAKRSDLDAQRSEILRERERAKNERASMAEELKAGAETYAELASRRRALLADASDPEASLDAEMPREIERLKSTSALLEEKRSSNFVLAERVASDIKSAEAEIASLDEQAAECDREIVDARAKISSMGRRYSDAANRRREIAIEMAEFAERYERIAQARAKRAARLETAASRLASAEAAAADVSRKLDDAAREASELAATWEEQYPYPGAGAFDDADPEALRRSIRERDRRVKALGDVDMGLLSEDRSLRDRLAYLGTQIDDVRGAMAELERLISDADEQARAVFTNALEEIDKKFCDMFQRLFTGGDARLDMIEGESLWDSGVDVVARPPGKRPQSIASLSGGEQSLSAIALLFASLDVANCPIAVLDEVDAALDEVNLRRFADLAKEASRERQIFVMTHRRVTMERADVLYGVTLAEPGLSQVIGVRVEDWA